MLSTPVLPLLGAVAISLVMPATWVRATRIGDASHVVPLPPRRRLA